MIIQKVPGGTNLLNPETILKDGLQIMNGALVGDFGCGSAAYFTFEAARQAGTGGLVYAVDIIKSVLENIEKTANRLKLNNVKTIWSNLEKFGACKINNNSLDFGLLINVLFQNKNRVAILKEVARMIKPNGKILVVDWKEGRLPIGPGASEKVPLNELLGMADIVGVKLEKQFEAGQYHYGVIFIK